MQKREVIFFILVFGILFSVVSFIDSDKRSITSVPLITGAQIGQPQTPHIEIIEPSQDYEVLQNVGDSIFVQLRGLSNDDLDLQFGTKVRFSLGSVIWTPALVSAGPISYLSFGSTSQIQNFFLEDAANLPPNRWITIRVQQRNRNTNEIINGYRTFCIDSCPQGFVQPGGGSSVPEPVITQAESDLQGMSLDSSEQAGESDSNPFTAAATAITGRAAPAPCIQTFAPGCGGDCPGDPDEVWCVAGSRSGGARPIGSPPPPVADPSEPVPAPTGCGCYNRADLPCNVGCHRDSPCPPAPGGGEQVCSGLCKCIVPQPPRLTYTEPYLSWNVVRTTYNRFPTPTPLPAQRCGCDEIFIATNEQITRSEWIKPMSVDYRGTGEVARYNGQQPPLGPTENFNEHSWLGPVSTYLSNMPGAAIKYLGAGTPRVVQYSPSLVAQRYGFQIFCHNNPLTNNLQSCNSNQGVTSTIDDIAWNPSANQWAFMTSDLDIGNPGPTVENAPNPVWLPRGPNGAINGRFSFGGLFYAPDDYRAINNEHSVVVKSKAGIIMLAASHLPQEYLSQVRSALSSHGDSATFMILQDTPTDPLDLYDLVVPGANIPAPLNLIIRKHYRSFRTRFWGNLGGMGCLFKLLSCFFLVSMPTQQTYGIAPAVIAPCGIIRVQGVEIDFRPKMYDINCYSLDDQGRAYQP